MSQAAGKWHFFIVFLQATLLSLSAQASPSCMKEKTPFGLSDDIVSWTMSAAPGSECIQGLRWSYMQIYQVVVLKEPERGKLVIVGSGFRYFADPDNPASDHFSLGIVGKNRHVLGTSILDIAVESAVRPVAGDLALDALTP